MHRPRELIVGMGVGIVDIERFSHVLQRSPRLLERLFNPTEIAYCTHTPLPTTHLALTFAAKQATLQVLGTGFAGIRFSAVTIERDGSGNPMPHLSDAAQTRADELGIIELHLSHTYTHATAVASAVALTAHARPAPRAVLTFEERMAQAFRETRSLLDEVEASASDEDVLRGAGGESNLADEANNEVACDD